MAGIRIGPGGHAKIGNSIITGWDVGVAVESGGSIEASNNFFSDVGVAYDIAPDTVSRITGTRIAGARPSDGKATTGYRRPNGRPLPAMCPRCGAIFPSRNYNIGSNRFYGFDNEETCRECGYEHAKLAAGLFDLAKETIKVIEAEQFTHDMLAAINASAADLLYGRADINSTVSRIGEISAPLAKILQAAWNTSGGWAGIIALYFLVMTDQLDKVKDMLGQTKLEHRSYEIERLCMDAFGEAAQCSITFQPIDDSAVGEVEPSNEHQEIPVPVKRPHEEDSQGQYNDLPDVGPIPRSRPEGHS